MPVTLLVRPLLDLLLVEHILTAVLLLVCLRTCARVFFISYFITKRMFTAVRFYACSQITLHINNLNT
jgi:hypothetical protein